MVDGFGAITWWGFSPALDLQDKYQCKLCLNLVRAPEQPYVVAKIFVIQVYWVLV